MDEPICFRGATLREALVSARDALGPEALIVRQHEGVERRFLGLVQRPFGAVYAVPPRAAERARDARRRAEGRADARARSARLQRAYGVPEAVGPEAAARALPAAPSPAPALPREPQGGLVDRLLVESLLREVAGVRRLVTEMAGRETVGIGGLPDALRAAHRSMLDVGLAPDVATELVRGVNAELSGASLHEPEAIRGRLRGALAARLRVAGPIREMADGPRVVALVGPTGVGKTTTIGKIASILKVRRHLRVGLVAYDLYRFAAVDQLRTLADLIDVPLFDAMTPADMRRARERMADRDVVLVDTAGRGHRDDERLREIGLLLSTVAPHEVHLVLSASADPHGLVDVADRFRPLGVDRVIFSKLDEAVRYGHLFQFAAASDLPVSYLTTGQQVPDDIEEGDQAFLADLVLGGAEVLASKIATRASAGHL